LFEVLYGIPAATHRDWSSGSRGRERARRGYLRNLSGEVLWLRDRFIPDHRPAPRL